MNKNCNFLKKLRITEDLENKKKLNKKVK